MLQRAICFICCCASFKNYGMKNLINIDSTTQFPIAGVITFFAVLMLLGCLCYFGWKMKGVVIYMGTIVTIIGLFLIYMGFTDSTL